MSDETSERRGGPPTRIDWAAEADRGLAASAARLKVAPEHLKRLDRARDLEVAQRRFANARAAVLTRWGNEIRADSQEAFVRGCAPAKLPEDRSEADYVERTEAIKQMETFLRETHGQQVLVFSGGTGVGKTLAALYGLAWYAARYPELSFGDHVHAADIAERVKPWRGSTLPPLNVRTSYLVIDDLGAENCEDARFQEAFDKLVNARQGLVQGHRQITVITTNEPSEKLFDRYGARVRSRLSGLTRAFDLVGKDMRTRRYS